MLLRLLAERNLMAVLFAAGDHVPFWMVMTAAGFVVLRGWMLVGMIPFVVYRSMTLCARRFLDKHASR